MNKSTRDFRVEMLRRYRNSRIPISGTFEITGRCNFNCKMCYVHTKSNDEFIKTEHNGDWWISIIEEACKQGMLFALLTGGECLLHPDFRRIYTFLRSKGVYTSINTNGFLLNEDMVDFLKKNPPYELQITLYGTDDDSYYNVTGVRGFSKVRDSIIRAKKANLNLKVAVTPNPYAAGETERIIRFLKEIQVPHAVNNSLFSPYDDNGEQTLSEAEFSVEEKIKYLSAIRSQPIEPIPYEDLPPVGGGAKGEVNGISCFAGVISFTVSHDGYMRPCNATHHVRVPVESKEDFLPVWGKMKSFADHFLLPIECEGCVYKKVCLPCPILRGGKVGKGHCDPAVCESTRKLVAAGVKKLEQVEKPCD